jgi:hypothetical protein
VPEFRFYHPIEVRYADIDAQRHVNNVAYFAYMESARARYLSTSAMGRQGLPGSASLAETACTYKPRHWLPAACAWGAGSVWAPKTWVPLSIRRRAREKWPPGDDQVATTTRRDDPDPGPWRAIAFEADAGRAGRP